MHRKTFFSKSGWLQMLKTIMETFCLTGARMWN